MDCCQCRGIEQQFDQAHIERNLKTYRKRGAEYSTRLLIAQLLAEHVAGATLLDIGGGVGAIQHALLEAGAATAMGVDASSASLEAARQEATRRGFADQVSYLFGDFVALAPTIPHADIVTLDRVVCCYHDMPGLVLASLACTQRLYGLVYPRDDWWVRLGVRLLNGGLTLQRNPFRIFCHRTAEVERLITSQGFERMFQRSTGMWQVVIFRRIGAANTAQTEPSA